MATAAETPTTTAADDWMPRYVSIAEAASRVGATPNLIRHLIRTGRLMPYTVVGRTVVLADAVAALVKPGRPGQAPGSRCISANRRRVADAATT